MQQPGKRHERTTGHGRLLEHGEPIARVNYAINVTRYVLSRRAWTEGTQPVEGTPSVSGVFMLMDLVSDLGGRDFVLRLADGREFFITVEQLAGKGVYRFRDREAAAAA